jgi:hypothetical protein
VPEVLANFSHFVVLTNHSRLVPPGFNGSMNLMVLLDFVVLMNHSVLGETQRRGNPPHTFNDFHGSGVYRTGSCPFFQKRKILKK